MRQPSPVNTERLGFREKRRGEVVRPTISVAVNQLKSRLVVEGGHVRLGNAQTDRIRKALAERTGGDLDAIGVASLGVTRGQRVELTEGLQVVKGQLEAEQMKENVLQSTSRKRLECRPRMAKRMYLRMSVKRYISYICVLHRK